MKIYTKGGDQGETGLLYGGRISKSDPRTECYGTLDEAISALGLGRALSTAPDVKELIFLLQRELFLVGADLATDPSEYATLKQHFKVVSPEMTTYWEKVIDDLEGKIELPAAFIIPGASAASGSIDLARAVIRRAERRSVELQQKGLLINTEILRYLNRVADAIFMIARYEDRGLPIEKLTGEHRKP